MSTTTLSSPSKGLRKRMNYLAQSKHADSQRASPSPSPSGSGSFEREEESGSGTEEGSSEYDDAESNPPSLTLPVRERTVEAETPWYADPTLMPLVVSSFFSWLTGGDVMKNLFLLVLSGWWLWQAREVPWRLYLSSRPRQRPKSHSHPSPSSETELLYKQLAESQLRSLEILLLSLTLLSPFFGAFVLRMISGQELSWFSTTLFVMASAWRPWSHLVERLQGRVEGLHDLVHYPPPPPSSEKDDTAGEIQHLKKHLADLEKSLLKLKERMNNKFEDVYDYVDDEMERVHVQIQGKGKERERSLRGAEEDKGWKWLPGWISNSSPTSPTNGTARVRRPAHHQHPSHHQHQTYPLETILEEPSSSGSHTQTAPPPYVAPNVGFIHRVVNWATSVVMFPVKVWWDLIWKIL